MQDELRAARLAAALDGDAPLEMLDDEELAALAALGAQLRRAGPDLAAISRAETIFSAAFAHNLAEQLRTAHPSAAQPVARTAPRAVWARGGRLLRSLIALIVLALAVAAFLAVTLLRGVQPGVQTGSAASPTVPARPARPRAMQSLATRPPAVAPEPHGTTPPGTPVAAMGPRSAAGTAAQPSARANMGFAPMAPHAQAQAGGPLTYKLPSPLPTLPARLPIYHVRHVPLSAAGAARIAVTFPGLRASASPPGVRVYSGPAGRLEIVLATGEVRYTTAPPSGKAPAAHLTTNAAAAVARSWLRAHDLYPVRADDAATTVESNSSLTRVTFAPRTPLPVATGTTLGVRVDLDSGGRVVAARRLWPTLTVASVAGVHGPALAVAAPRARQAQPTDHAAPQRPAPPAPLFRVEQIIPGYALSADGARLLPVYVLVGVVTAADGTNTPTTQVLPATDQQ